MLYTLRPKGGGKMSLSGEFSTVEECRDGAERLFNYYERPILVCVGTVEAEQVVAEFDGENFIYEGASA